MITSRDIVDIIPGRATSDGDGVKLLRIFGGSQPEHFDPFLLLDEFGSEEASDYIGGFPPHPHRGFETITYMLEGKMEHRDHMDNVGLLSDGGVQWMTAGRGVIHSEMPKQTEGKMRGFQLWLNLPAEKKMQAAHYEDVNADKIPVFQLPSAKIKAIAGSAEIDGQSIQGYFSIPDTEAHYFDVHLAPGNAIDIPIQDGFASLLYAYGGNDGILIGKESSRQLKKQHLARMSQFGTVSVRNDSEYEAQFLVLAGKPLKQPVVQYGPFVMNSMDEIQQAIDAYKQGVLTDDVGAR